MRKMIICARRENSDTFDIVAQTNDAAVPVCPLARLLPHMTGDFDTFFSALVEQGILKSDHGHYAFASLSSPCPFTQALPEQATEDEQEQTL